MNKQYIHDKIAELINIRIESKISPYHIEDRDLYNAIIADVKPFLNELYRENKIEVGKTLNGHYINTKK